MTSKINIGGHDLEIRSCGRVDAHPPHSHGEHYEEWCPGTLSEVDLAKARDDQQRIVNLAAWWRCEVEAEIAGFVPKSIEYGSADLDLIGETCMMLNPEAWAAAPHEERARIRREMAIAFYIQGKVARLFGAYAAGRLPSDDTWHDLAVYTKMAQANRAGVYGQEG